MRSETQMIQSDQIFCRLDFFISSTHNLWPFNYLAELAMLQTTKTNGLSGLFVQWILMIKLITNILNIFLNITEFLWFRVKKKGKDVLRQKVWSETKISWSATKLNRCTRECAFIKRMNFLLISFFSLPNWRYRTDKQGSYWYAPVAHRLILTIWVFAKFRTICWSNSDSA